MSEPTPSHPTRVLAFSGPVAEFLDRLAQWVAASSADPRNLAHSDAYEWELTATIARHPEKTRHWQGETGRYAERLAAVEALCDARERGQRWPGPVIVEVREVRAAARGED